MQEGRGIGLADKLKAYNLQDKGHGISHYNLDTVNANILLSHPPDARSYHVASLILRDLGVESVKLLTNNPEKINSLKQDGIKISEHISMIPKSWTEEYQNGRNKELDGYIITKVEKMNHQLIIPPRVRQP